jgi:hypothetical protein
MKNVGLLLEKTIHGNMREIYVIPWFAAQFITSQNGVG